MLVLAPLFVAWPFLRALFERGPVRASLAPCALVLSGFCARMARPDSVLSLGLAVQVAPKLSMNARRYGFWS